MRASTSIAGLVGIVGLLVVLPVGACRSPSSAAAAESDFTIRVSGSNGLGFTGSYQVTTAGGSSSSSSINSTVPAEYTARGRSVSARFEKHGGEQGKLRVEILKGGKVVIDSQTDAQHGVLSVSAQ